MRDGHLHTFTTGRTTVGGRSTVKSYRVKKWQEKILNAQGQTFVQFVDEAFIIMKAGQVDNVIDIGNVNKPTIVSYMTDEGLKEYDIQGCQKIATMVNDDGTVTALRDGAIIKLHPRANKL